LDTHAAYRQSIETVEVPDITAPNAFDSAVQGVGGVVHMASPVIFGDAKGTQLSSEESKAVERDMLLPAINGTTQILKSIVKNAPDVRRVVITSSIAAIIDFSQGLRPGWVYDESQWNPVTYETAITVPGRAYACVHISCWLEGDHANLRCPE
jgi:nucleoside-diphosphate-sugar epimerase